MAIVRYLKKQSSALDMDISMHRALTLKSVLGKFFTRIMLVRLSLILSPHIPHSQVGYQAQLGSYTTVWAVKRLVREIISSGSQVWVLLCDWAKAYDKVWRAMVLLIINAMGVTGNLWLLTHEWIYGTVTVAFFNGVVTDPYEVQSVLGQGCVLSALLFLMFIRTISDSAPPMHPGYHYQDLVTRLHSSRLPDHHGVSTNETSVLEMIAAIICADDTTLLSSGHEGMERLVDALYTWKRKSRFETNDSKFHLMVHRPIKHTDSHGIHYTSSHDKDATIQLPGHPKTTQSEPSAILLGCQLRTSSSDEQVWKHYVKHVVPHQLTLQRVLHQVGHSAALEFVRAVVQGPLLNAAASDVDTMLHPHVMDKLQRALWCGGDTTALGISRYANSMVVHRILGSLQWSRELQ